MSLKFPSTFFSNPPACFDGQFDWDWLIPAFQEATGRRIQPMDIDFHVEVGGHHLVFETKAVGTPIPGGQRRALLQLWAKGHHTVVFLHGKGRDWSRAEIYYPSGRRTFFEADACVDEAFSTDKLRDLCFRWATWAEANPHPFQFSGAVD